MPTVTVLFDAASLKVVKFNDMYGHQEGDWYIKNVAQTINATMGEQYKGIRYGGDEIIIITENPSLAEFEQKIQGVGQTLHRIGHDHFKPYKMSISQGFAVYPNAAVKYATDLIEEADMNMYEHKKAKKAARPTESVC